MKKIPFLYKYIKKNKVIIDKTVIALVGLQLTRKAQAVIVGKSRGYFVISTGDYIRNKCKKFGNNISFNNVAKVSKITNEFEILDRLIFKNNHLMVIKKSRGIIIDNIKSLEGIEFLFRNFADVIVVGFLASTSFRYKHSKMRNRTDESKNAMDFDERDRREMEKGIANILLLSDYFVLAGSIKESRKQFEEILNEIEK